MYLSRISLSPEAADDVRFGGVFDSPYQLHQEIWTLFSDDPNRRRDFLYRLDQEGRKEGRPRVFSLSNRAPRPLPGVWQVETREFRPTFEVGDRLRFVLRANPVVARSGSRHDVVTDAIRKLKEQAVPRRAWPSPEQIVRSACIDWLARRAETHGFALGRRGEGRAARGAVVHQARRLARAAGGLRLRGRLAGHRPRAVPGRAAHRHRPRQGVRQRPAAV